MPFNFSPLWNRFCLWPSITFYQAASVITHAFKVPFTSVDEVGLEADSLLSPISSHRRGEYYSLELDRYVTENDL